jgi:hypothetical protein
MRVIRIVLPAVFVLSLAGFAFSQEPRDEAKPPEQSQPKREADRDVAAPRQDESKPPKEREEAKPPKPEQREEKQEAARPPKNEAQPNREAKPVPQERGEQSQQAHSRPAGRNARIPDDKFRAHFGREHTFAVRQTVVVEGQPRFQYSGYWFVLVDPWPAEWAYTDDCYVDYVDGDYFLFDLLHPGVRIALFVAM